ncbi:MAG: sensor histidine kinase [Longimicrobiales bacterium]
MAEIPVVEAVPVDAIVFDEGEEGDAFFLIAEGTVRISKRSAGGRQQLLSLLTDNDYFGEMAVVDPAPRSARATATRATVLGRVDQDGQQRMLAVAPATLARNLMIDAIQRLRGADRLLIEELVRSERLGLIGSMTAGIIHDLKNPLSVISGVAQLLALEGKPDHARWASMLDRATATITALVQDILEFARGTSSIALEAVAAETLLRDLDDFTARRFTRQNIERTDEILIDSPIRVDRLRFGRVLMNILTNAADAMPEGGAIRLRVEEREGRICFDITDTGSGIPDDILPVIFEPFTTHNKQGGTGLGLAIAKSIVEAHSGEILVTTTVGQGTTFSIMLPAQR